MNFICSQCPDDFKSQDELRMHMETKHTVNETIDAVPKSAPAEKKCQCTICHQSFASNGLLQKHREKVHKLREFQREDGKFVCPECGRVSDTEGGNRVHMSRSKDHLYTTKESAAPAAPALPEFNMSKGEPTTHTRTMGVLEADHKTMEGRIAELEAQKAAIDVEIHILKIQRDYNKRIQATVKDGAKGVK